jgi:hypothetical protein
MGLNPILLEMSSVEKKLFELLKELSPSSVYIKGIEECAGKFFIPSEKNLKTLRKKLANILRESEDKTQRDVINSLIVSLEFHEPYMVPSDLTDTFFVHLVKEGIVTAHMKSLTKDAEQALDAYVELLSRKDWPIEIKILTCQKTDGLIGILDTIVSEAKDKELKNALLNLKRKTQEYRKIYMVEGIQKGDFNEVYPILQKTKNKINHKAIYPKLLKKFWGYPETITQIETKATKWLRKELPYLKKITKRLAKIYRTEENVEILEEEMTRRKSIPKQQALDFVKQTRRISQKVFEKHIVKITPKYETRVIETPSYLVNFTPTAAMMAIDGWTDHPFNVFFVTTDPSASPSSSIPDIIQSLLHEEYGHAVNFSNSATRYAAKPTFSEFTGLTGFSTQISDGIAFFREFEFARMLKELAKRKTLDKDEAEFLKILKTGSDTETMLLENEFVVWQWRIMRFLRAIFDARINMGKQNIVDFVEWAYKETGLSKKMIYNQTWIFLSMVGYAPCYSMAGNMIQRLQNLAIKNGISMIDFNTYVSSLGFPPRKIFEEKLKTFVQRRGKTKA